MLLLFEEPTNSTRSWYTLTLGSTPSIGITASHNYTHACTQRIGSQVYLGAPINLEKAIFLCLFVQYMHVASVCVCVRVCTLYLDHGSIVIVVPAEVEVFNTNTGGVGAG